MKMPRTESRHPGDVLTILPLTLLLTGLLVANPSNLRIFTSASEAEAAEEHLSLCGTTDDLTSIQQEIQADSNLVMVVVFIGFQDDSVWTLPAWADSLETQIPVFIDTMSGGRKHVETIVARRPGNDSALAWITSHDLSYYMTPEQNGCEGVNAEIFPQVDSLALSPGYFDSLGARLVSIIYSRCPAGGNFGGYDYCGPSAGFTGPAPGVPAGVYAHGATLQHREFFSDGPRQMFLLAHEMGHVLSLVHPGSSGSGGAYGDSVHVGIYSLMRATTQRSNVLFEGLIPYDAVNLSRSEIGWATRDTICCDRRDARIPDFLTTMPPERRVLVLKPPDTAQYFLLAYYRGMTAYDAKYAGSGLLIWHILPSPTGVRYDKAWDVELASGKWTPNGLSDPESGKDSLEANQEYLSGPGDFFDGGTHGTFGCATNPNTNLYEDSTWAWSPQSIRTGLEIRNIHGDGNDIVMDIYVDGTQNVLAPNGGEYFARGDSIVVEWEERDCAEVDSVEIWLRGGCSNAPRLLTVTSNTGFYGFSALQPPGDDYRIEIRSRAADGKIYVDESDSTFSVVDVRQCSTQEP